MIKTVIKKLNQLSIFRKLILIFILSIVIPLFITYFYSAAVVEDIMISRGYSDSLQNLKLINNTLNNYITKVSLTTMNLYVNEDIVELLQKELNDENKNNRLENIKLIRKIDNTVQNLTYNATKSTVYTTLISSGKVIYTNYKRTSYNKLGPLIDYSANKIKEKNRYITWKGIEENYIGEEKALYPYVITVGKSIEKINSEKLIGYFLLSIPEKVIRKFINNEDNTTRILLDKNRQVISSTDPNFLTMKFNQIYDEEMSMDKKHGYIVSKLATGTKSLITYTKVEANDWVLIDIKPYNQLTGMFFKVARRLLLVTIVSIIIFLTVAALFARSITKPIHKLSVMMEETDFEDSADHELNSPMNEIAVLQDSFNNMKKNISNLLIEVKEQEEKKRKAELQALQAQISPHFLFNTLNTVRCASLNNKPKKAAEMVLALVKLLKMTISREDEFISLKEEIDNIRNYVAILQNRYSTTFDVIYDIDENVKKLMIPKLLLQPIVENAIIHGFQGKDGKGIIKIKAKLYKDKTIITIEDNGKGMENVKISLKRSVDKSTKFTGIGINNVDERIKLNFGTEYGLEINSQCSEGTVVKILLPGGNSND